MKKILIILVALQFIAIGVLVYFRVKDNYKEDVSIQEQAKQNVDLDVKNINKKLDIQGMQHLIMSDKENVIQSTKELNDTSKKQVDSLTKQLGIKEKQLREWKQYAVTVRDSFLMAKMESDTSYRASSKWANFEFVLPKDKTKSSYLNYSYNAEINYAEYWKKKTFISPKKQYIDFWINDPNATVNGVKRVRIEPKEKAKLELNSIMMYQKDLNAGFEATLKKGRFSIGGAYMYNLQKSEWEPYYYTKLKLLEF